MVNKLICQMQMGSDFRTSVNGVARNLLNINLKRNVRRDAYVAILTVLAIAFFLLGIAQSSVRMRLFFAGSAVVIMTLAAVWTGYIMIA